MKTTTRTLTGTLATLALAAGAAMVPMTSATAADDPTTQPGLITVSEESKAILESVGLETSYQYGALKITATPGQEESTLVYGRGIYTEDSLPVLAPDSTLSRNGGLGYVSTLEDNSEHSQSMYPAASTAWKQGGTTEKPAGITWVSDNIAGGVTPEIREGAGLRDYASDGFVVSDCVTNVCGFYVQSAERQTWFEDGTLEPAALDDTEWQALRTTGPAIFVPVTQSTRSFLSLKDVPDGAEWSYGPGRATAKWLTYEDEDGYTEYETFTVYGSSDTGTDAHLSATPWVSNSVIPEEMLVRRPGLSGGGSGGLMSTAIMPMGAAIEHRVEIGSFGNPQHVGSINVAATAGWDSAVPTPPMPPLPEEPPVVIPPTPVTPETPVVVVPPVEPETPVVPVVPEVITPEEPVVPEVTPQVPDRIESGAYGLSRTLLWMGTLLVAGLTLIGARFARYSPSHKA